ncbi:MAG: hypothetical protein ACRDHK_09255, partial [Actinomycetota bacterium]
SLLIKMATAGQTLMVLKDFGTIISTRYDERGELLQQLREVYDGSFRRDTGAGKELSWRGRLGFLAGSTPAIDQHAAVLGALGERWIYLRLGDVDEDRITGAAFDQYDEDEMRDGLRQAMSEFIEGLDFSNPPEPAPVREGIKLLARRTAWIRTAVQRDNYTRDIVERPVPERPTRLAKQLKRLWQAAVVIEHEDPLGFVARIARDSIKPVERREVLDLLAMNGPTTTEVIRGVLDLPVTTGKRIVEDLEALRLIVRTPGTSTGGRPPIRWAISPRITALSYPESTTSEGTKEQGDGEVGHTLGFVDSGSESLNGGER